MLNPQFSPLSDKERAWIAHRLEATREFVAEISPDHAGKRVTLDALDRAYAAWLAVANDNTDQINGAINAMGVQFGQVLVDELAFEWTIAKDPNGTDLAVRALPGRRDVLIYPPNVVAKRWQRKEVNFLPGSAWSATAAEEPPAPRRPRWQPDPRV